MMFTLSGKRFSSVLLMMSTVFFSVISPSVYAAYTTNIEKASSWLVLNQNSDGGWGDVSDAKRFVITAEVVGALQAANIRNAAYYRGLTWLENHATNSVDSQARAAVLLGLNGNNVDVVFRALQLGQRSNGGWGLGSAYLAAPIDTALVLHALPVINASTAQMTLPINYLKATQLQGGGWSLGNETTIDKFSTAWVIRALAPLKVIYTSDTALITAIDAGVNALKNTVTSSDSVVVQALSADAALLAGQSVIAQPWLTNLVNLQSSNGNFNNNDVYATALALNAFANADGLKSSANRANVSVPDPVLRMAINAALGRNAMDNLNRAELAKLTTLSASNLGIRDLTGLEYAINLTSVILSNNSIVSTAPLSGLTQITTLRVDGNPVAGDNDPIAVPTLSEWGVILMIFLLVSIAIRGEFRRTHLALSV